MRTSLPQPAQESTSQRLPCSAASACCLRTQLIVISAGGSSIATILVLRTAHRFTCRLYFCCDFSTALQPEQIKPDVIIYPRSLVCPAADLVVSNTGRCTLRLCRTVPGWCAASISAACGEPLSIRPVHLVSYVASRENRTFFTMSSISATIRSHNYATTFVLRLVKNMKCGQFFSLYCRNTCAVLERTRHKDKHNAQRSTK